jgi:uncharacterized membrane protein
MRISVHNSGEFAAIPSYSIMQQRVLLKLRLAKGEITKAEYDDIKKALEE